MALPTSGAISMSQVNTELGKAADAAVSMNDTDVRTLAGVSSGAISMSNLHGKSSLQPPTVTLASSTAYATDDGGTGRDVRLTLGGGTATSVTATRISGSSNCVLHQNVSNTRWLFQSNVGGINTQTRTATWRFTATNAAGSGTRDVSVSVIDAYYDGCSCFPAGVMVTMADGSHKAIEDVVIGDWLKTATGVAQVHSYVRPKLEHRPMYVFEDGRCPTSGEHPFWGRNPATQEQWWASRDIEEWRFEASLGLTSTFGGHEPVALESDVSSWDFASENGWERLSWRQVDAPSDTQLYHFVLEGGESYFADGFIVQALSTEELANWESFNWGEDS